MKCLLCQANNADGALICSSCGEPIDPSGPGVASSGSVTPPASNTTGPSTPIPTKKQLRFVLLNQGSQTDKGFDLPPIDFTFLLGRPDLISQPPIVPDVDLSGFTTPSPGVDGSGKTGEGFHVSRRHATITGTTNPDNSMTIKLKQQTDAKTLYKSASGGDWSPVEKGNEIDLAVGSEVGFGSTSSMIFFRLIEK